MMKMEEMNMKIAILGTGLMGTGFAEGLMNAGHDVIVYNRTLSKTAPLVELGAKAVTTATEAIESADASILVLMNGTAVQEILLSEETKRVLKDKKILNASTTTPEEIIEIAKEVSLYGGELAEASILTGADELRNRQSAFFLGCNATDKDFWMEILQSVSLGVHYVGETGTATQAETPIVFSSVFGLITAAYAASVAIKFNLPQEIMDMYRGMLGPGGDYMFPKMIAREYDESFASVDSNLSVAAAARSSAKFMGFPEQVFEAMSNLLEEASKRGYGEKDGSAVCEVILDPKGNNN